jgi:hypothetical protein
MDVSYMHEATWNDAFAAQWAIWQAHKKYYPNEAWWWWCRYVKLMIKKYFIKTATTRLHDRKQLENFYYDAIYYLLNEPNSDQTHTKLRHLKAKIVRLYTAPHHCRYVDIVDTDVLEGESHSL